MNIATGDVVRFKEECFIDNYGYYDKIILGQVIETGIFDKEEYNELIKVRYDDWTEKYITHEQILEVYRRIN